MPVKYLPYIVFSEPPKTSDIESVVPLGHPVAESGVGVRDGVRDGVRYGVGVGVRYGVGVEVGVRYGVRVRVRVCSGVGVEVRVRVRVGVCSGVGVEVRVRVRVGVCSGVGVEVRVGVGVGVVAELTITVKVLLRWYPCGFKYVQSAATAVVIVAIPAPTNLSIIPPGGKHGPWELPYCGWGSDWVST
jgi:hypothetical protein